MFYQTTLQSVKNGVAVDVRGKRLSFIGYLQVQAGDAVWTDGNVIFGNVPPKSTPNIAEPLKGVPVLGNDLRGYITKIGGYREKNIATDDWITNDKKNFQHGENEINGQKVIDAVYLQNDSSEQDEVNLYVVTDGLYRKNQCVKYNNHLWIWRNYGTTTVNPFSTIAYTVLAYAEIYQGEEITLGVESADVNKSMKIYRDDDLINEIDLKPYADFITEKVQTTGQELISLSADSGVNYFKQPVPPKSFIASTYARPVTFRISNTGDWDAIIFASAYGYCFPYETMEGSVLEGTFNDTIGASTAFSENLINCLSNLEKTIFSDKNFPFLEIEKYPAFTGDKKIDEQYTAEYKKYIKEKIEYYIPLVRFKWSMWFTVTFGGSCLLRVHNGEIISVMRLDISGGNYIYPPIEWNETYKNYPLNARFFINGVHETNEWTFPIEDGFYFAGKGNQIKSVFDSNNNLIADFSALDLNIGLYCTRMGFLTLKDYLIDSRAETVRALANVPNISLVWGRYIDMPSSDYTVEDKDGERYFYESHGYLIYDEYPNLKNIENHSLMDGFFDAQSDDGFFRFNPCVCKLSDGNYLIGVHEGEFFVKRNGAWEKINDKLKNFRLREMKNLNTAKRE